MSAIQTQTHKSEGYTYEPVLARNCNFFFVLANVPSVCRVVNYSTQAAKWPLSGTRRLLQSVREGIQESVTHRRMRTTRLLL
jgi:hypothetical protein